MEAWYDEEIPDYYTAVTEKGYVNDQIAFEWLQKFYEETKDCIRKGEKCILIFDGYIIYKTVEFI